MTQGTIQPMDKERYEIASRLLNAAHEFWKANNNAGIYGAVQWLIGTDGELIIFTRGEYRQQLMANIATIPGVKEIDFFGESIEEPNDDTECN